MLITLSHRTAICQSVAEVQLTGVAPLGDGYCTKEIKTRTDMAKEAFNGKNITFDNQAKHLTQEEVGQVLCLEHYFIWLRDLGTNNNGAEVPGEF